MSQRPGCHKRVCWPWGICVPSLPSLTLAERLPKRGDTWVISSLQTSSCPARGHGIPGSLLPSQDNSPEQHTSPRFTYPSNVSLPYILFSHAHSAAVIYSFLNLLSISLTIHLLLPWGPKTPEKALAAPLFLQ